MNPTQNTEKVSWRRSIVIPLLAMILVPLVLEGGLLHALYTYTMSSLVRDEAGVVQQEAMQSARNHLEDLVQGPISILEKFHSRAESAAGAKVVVDLVAGQARAILAKNATKAAKRTEILSMVDAAAKSAAPMTLWLNDKNAILAHSDARLAGLPLKHKSLGGPNREPSAYNLMTAECLRPSSKGISHLSHKAPAAGGGFTESLSYMRRIKGTDLFVGGSLNRNKAVADLKRQALAEIRDLRLPDGNYFWANDLSPTMLMHPLRRDLEGTDMSGFEDTRGKRPFNDMVAICRDRGQGFVDYHWIKPGDDTGREYHKLSFVKLFKPWGIVVGMGVYTDDMEAAAALRAEKCSDSLFKATMTTLAWCALPLAVIVILTVTAMERLILRPVASLQRFASRVVAGDLQTRIGQGRFLGELGALRRAMRGMLDHLKDHIARTEAKSEEAREEAERARLAVAEAEEANRSAQMVKSYQKGEIKALAKVLTALAQGDLTTRYAAGPAENEASEARIAFLELEKLLNSAISDLAQLMNSVQAAGESFTGAAREFLRVSGEVTSSSEKVSERSGNVAGVTEQIAQNINSMAAATDEMSANIHTVSSTAEEMSMTMENVAQSVEGLRQSTNSIARNAADGADVADEATSRAQAATTAMRQLGEAAQQIGKVTGVIKRIAEQTNLLALNATIEAASAGEAGRGFAVVAHEIKELANQSAKAAEDIAGRIEGVQDNTTEAVLVIGEVADIIAALDEAMGVISTAVKCQTEDTNAISISVSETNTGAGEIARSISDLAKGAQDISANAGDIARGTSHAARNIVEVSRAAGDASSGAQRVHDLADDLADQAASLRKKLDRFTTF